jgi:hypothetical protein
MTKLMENYEVLLYLLRNADNIKELIEKLKEVLEEIKEALDKIE